MNQLTTTCEKRFNHSDEAKQRQSDAKKEWHRNNPNFFRGDNHPMWGSERSEDYRENLQNKNSIAVRGFKMINKTTGTKEKVPYEEVLDRVQKDWSFIAKRINVNNGIINKLIYPKNLEDMLNEGWEMGSLVNFK